MYFRDLAYVSKVHDDDLYQRNLVVYSTSDDDRALLMVCIICINLHMENMFLHVRNAQLILVLF